MWQRSASWAALALVLGSGVASAASLNETARLLESSATATRFEVTVPVLRMIALAAPSGASATRIEIDGFTPSDVAGEPELPTRIFTVAVPPGGTVRVSAVALGETASEGVALVRVPYLSRDGEVEEGVPSDLATPAPAQPEWARLVDVTWMREQRIARIEVLPVRYDAALRRVRSAGRVIVTVQLDGAIVTAGAVPAIDAFEPMYRALLVNYEQGRAWRSRTASTVMVAPKRATGFSTQAFSVPDTSIYIGHRWIKIGIRRSGFYKLPFSAFKSLAPFRGDTTIASDSLRMYTWSGLPILPERSFCDTCGYREVALGFIDDDTKMNHNSDAIYFYALGPNDWADRFDASQPDTVYINHPYETRNFYYLGVSTSALPLPGPRKRIALRSAAPTGGATVTPATFTARIHSEVDADYDPDRFPGTSSYFWDKWYWQKLKESQTFSSSVDAPGADTQQAARLRMRLWSCTGTPCTQTQTVAATWNGANVGPGTFSWRNYTGFTVDGPVSVMRRLSNVVHLTVSDLVCTVNTNISVYWYDLFYARTFEPAADRLEFSSPAGSGTYLYDVGPFQGATPPRLFDVTDPVGAVEITGGTYTAVTGGYRLAFESTDNARARYVAMPDSGFSGIASGDVVAAGGGSVDNLRSHINQADYLVIYFDPLVEAADALVTWRGTHNVVDGHTFRTKAVPVSAIYDQFSGGRTDPTAIRNFLRSAFYNWGDQPPAFVTLLGDASYDFKAILSRPPAGQPGDPLPTYENNYDPSSQAQRQFTTDDWLFNVDSAGVIIPDFMGGRLPMIDAASALAVVRDKVVRYERASLPGLYRDRVMLIADDNRQGEAPDPLSWAHLQQTSTLDTLSLPSSFDRDYVYLHTYPTRANHTKPDVRDSIVSHLEHEGDLVVNYVGHGSPFKLADESVLIATDADALTNAARLPLFVAASCDVGRFSDATSTTSNSSLGEHLINSTVGGAIGVISSTDLAFSGANATLNKVIFQSLFGRLGNGEMSGGVAAALLLGKLSGSQGNSQNALKYQLMGDAATRISLPQYWVDLEIRDDQGTDTTSILQGRRMSFTGRVLDRPQGSLVPLNGTADVLVEDSKPFLQAPECDDSTYFLCGSRSRPYYFFDAGPVFRGPAAVHAGVFSGQFIVPLEARPGVRGRVRAYLSGAANGLPSADAAGDLKVGVITGASPPGDVKGPEIRLSFANGATRVLPDALLHVDLSDSSGILITGHTPQNGIILTMDGNSTSRVDLTDGFRYSAGSYQAGSVTFQLPKLPEGFHTISVSAADNLAIGLAAARHRSLASLEFEVVVAPPLRVVSSYLFPDPVRSTGNSRGGQFVVDTEGGAVDVQLRIFTAAGRLVRRLTASGAAGQVQLPWDGVDAEGQGLANGVYLYKVVLRSAAAGPTTEAARHDEAVGRFVIVNP